MSKYSLPLLALLICLTTPQVFALEVQVNGLFSGKAVLSINGKQRILRAGQSSPEGVRLIRANSDVAVVDINGQIESLALNTRIGSNFSAASRKKVSIARNRNNAYYVNGSINGRSARMLVDTGATSVAMNSADAKRLGIDYIRNGKKGSVSTASGVTEAWFVRLDHVSIAGIKVSNVQAGVLQGAFPQQILLGMSFLSRVKMEESDGVLILSEK
ncbi:MAG: TIGR02281 family clan AA aspartic protease [Pseudomonadales bacterium]